MQGMASPAPEVSDSLMDVLRLRAAQARDHGTAYLAPVADPDSMLYWLTQAAGQMREAAGRIQVHVAASLSVDQSTIGRFESGISWPRNPDKTIRAYADDLDIEPIQIWEEALRLWAEHRASTPPDAVQIVEQGSQQRQARPARSGASKRRSPSSAAA